MTRNVKHFLEIKKETSSPLESSDCTVKTHFLIFILRKNTFVVK